MISDQGAFGCFLTKPSSLKKVPEGRMMPYRDVHAIALVISDQWTVIGVHFPPFPKTVQPPVTLAPNASWSLITDHWSLNKSCKKYIMLYNITTVIFQSWFVAVSGPRAMETHESCQVREEAAISGPFHVPRCILEAVINEDWNVLFLLFEFSDQWSVVSD